MNTKNRSLKVVVALNLVIMMGLSGCASLFGDRDPESQSGKEVAGAQRNASERDSVSTSTEGGVATLGNEVDISYQGMKIENNRFDIPVEIRPEVEKWVKYFTGKGRDRFAHYLERSEYFIPFLKPILRDAKAPQDLVYLAMIESGFNNNARSHARAVGAWQFIAPTGRRYGLEVSWWIDERRDVEKSTVAAIQYLKELNAMFGSWHLAMAAYNAGESKIQRAIKKYKTNDFWELCKRGRYLKPETKNYVPKLFAAAIVAKNRVQFGFEENYTKVKTQSGARIATGDDSSIEKLPDLLEGDADKGAETGTDSLVEITKDSPVDAEEEAMLAEDSVETLLKEMSPTLKTPHVNRQGQANGTLLTEVEIPSPADLFKVSSAVGLSYAEFKSMNPELLRWITPPTEKNYRIKLPANRKEDFMKKYFTDGKAPEVDFLAYKARRGDSPRSIAKRFGISPEPVAQMNGTSVNSSLMPGKLIELPIPSDFVRSLASLKSLDLIDPTYPRRKRIRNYRRRKASSKVSVHSSQSRREPGSISKKSRY